MSELRQLPPRRFDLAQRLAAKAARENGRGIDTRIHVGCRMGGLIWLVGWPFKAQRRVPILRNTEDAGRCQSSCDSLQTLNKRAAVPFASQAPVHKRTAQNTSLAVFFAPSPPPKKKKASTGLRVHAELHVGWARLHPWTSPFLSQFCRCLVGFKKNMRSADDVVTCNL